MEILRYIATTVWREATMLAKTIWAVFIVIPAAMPIVAARLDWPWLKDIASILPWWGWLWTAVIIAICGLLFAIAKRAQQLEEEAKPSLDIEFRNDSSCLVVGYMTISNQNGEPVELRGTIVRIVVRNTNPITSTRARCIIPKIDGYEHVFSNQNLQPLHAEPVFSLAPDGEQIVGVLFVPDDVSYDHIFIDYDRSLTSIGRTLPRQNYRMMIQAVGIESGSVSRWLVVNLDNGIAANLEN